MTESAHVSPAASVLLLRGGLVESTHEVALAVVDPDGRVVLEGRPGDAALPVFVRSAAKPFQALPAVAAGVPERLGLDDRHLALAAASHRGGRGEARLARAVLDAAGLPEAALGCGVAEPLDEDEAAGLRARGEAPGPLRHMCSGNHALALAHCVLAGWPTARYLDPDHPVQVRMREAVGAATMPGAGAVEEAVDGCGMRTYRLPLAALARGFGRLASGRLDADGDRVAAAMRGHPDLVGGAGVVDTELMRALPGSVAKVGAEGVLAVGLADGRALAVKVRDGAHRALGPAAVAAVRAGLGAALDGLPPELVEPPVRNARGELVGALRVGPRRPAGNAMGAASQR